MSKKKPNNLIAPIVIAGITVGFLASAYKFVFAKPKKKKNEHAKEEESQQNSWWGIDELDQNFDRCWADRIWIFERYWAELLSECTSGIFRMRPKWTFSIV